MHRLRSDGNIMTLPARGGDGGGMPRVRSDGNIEVLADDDDGPPAPVAAPI